MYLALDQSPKRIGFAYGSPGAGIIPGSGVVRLKRGIFELRDWLTLMLSSKGVVRVGYEAPFVGPKTRHDTLFQICELPGIIKLVCGDAGILCEAVPPPTWRKHFIGVGNAPKARKSTRTRWLKDEAMRACVERGWPIASDDEADALGILDYLLCRDFGGHGADTSPLFRGEAA